MGYVEDAYDFTERYDNQFIGSATDSVTFGELIEDGWVDFTDPSWDFPKYDAEQHARLCRKIENHYWSRDIGVLPPKQWKREFLRKLDEIMPKYITLYGQIAETGSNGLNARDEGYKSRNIVSDFPQTQLAGNEDYASMGTDHQYERIHRESLFDYVERIRMYDDVDLLIINELESLFSCLLTVNANAW